MWEQGAQPGHVHSAPVVGGALAALAKEAACTCVSCKYLTRHLPRLGSYCLEMVVWPEFLCVFFKGESRHDML